MSDLDCLVQRSCILQKRRHYPGYPFYIYPEGVLQWNLLLLMTVHLP